MPAGGMSGSSVWKRLAFRKRPATCRIRSCLGGSQLTCVGSAPMPAFRMAKASGTRGVTGANAMSAEKRVASCSMGRISSRVVTTQ